MLLKTHIGIVVMFCIGDVSQMYIFFPLSYNFDTSTWDAVPTSGGPLYRYGHSLALYQVIIYRC